MTTIVRRRRLGMSSAKGIVSFSKEGIDWCRNDLGVPNDDVYIRWGCTSNLPNGNATVLNSSIAIHRVANKLEFRRLLEEHELCPKTWFRYMDVPVNSISKGVIIRTKRHHQGRGLWLVYNYEDLEGRCDLLGSGNYYLSEYIKKVAEYRVFVVSGRTVCVAEKTPADPNSIAWNVARGGIFDNVKWTDWNLKAVRIAMEAFKLSKLDFGGVDIMVDADGDCTVLEINSAPSLTSPYRQECMAKGFDWAIKYGKENIPLIRNRGGYRKFIHPAVCNRAKIGVV